PDRTTALTTEIFDTLLDESVIQYRAPLSCGGISILAYTHMFTVQMGYPKCSVLALFSFAARIQRT
ncbi:MAG TPA: hypothetical protein PLX99_13175, partial [Gammaproteobacteria bacterium]|nr:hypothetical protein [Gammaproteobacteria bacterium]